MRLDLYLFEHGFVKSRTEAKTLIESGSVFAGGKCVTKPAFAVEDDADDILLIREDSSYVSRGGQKLEAALSVFGVDVRGKSALDVGASSGGFTDCLLKAGAARVVAVDSGCGQLDPSLRKDPRVTSFEKFNARFMKPSDLPFAPEICVMDVSFISATYIIPAVYSCLLPGGDYLLLIKPQFEVGRAGLGKGGIVKDEKARRAAVERVVSFAKECGFDACGTVVSPILGGDGNVEYLSHFKKPKEG